jgi:hypothetical protein
LVPPLRKLVPIYLYRIKEKSKTKFRQSEKKTACHHLQIHSIKKFLATVTQYKIRVEINDFHIKNHNTANINTYTRYNNNKVAIREDT